jgi:glycosyltransferase involved in cell wall biosynthesis
VGAGDRPRVLHVGPDVRGGMGTSLRALFGSRLGRDYELEFVATHTGTGVVRRLTVFAAALARIAVWCLRRRGRIVHVHSTVRGSMYRKAACVLLARGLGCRVVFHIHSGPGDVATFRAGLGPLSRAYLRLAYRHSDAVLAVSGASAEALQAAFGAEGIVVVPNAVPAVAASPGGGSEGPPLAVYLGGFANPVKGGEVLLEALRDPAIGDLRFVLAGPGEPPPDRLGEPAIESPAEVGWRGWLEEEEKAALLREADAFVLASTSEGLPMALLEAMSYGLAIVATAVGGITEVVEDGVQALVVPPADPGALAAALARLGREPELIERLGAAALARAADFAPDAVAGRIEEVYRTLL